MFGLDTRGCDIIWRFYLQPP